MKGAVFMRRVILTSVGIGFGMNRQKLQQNTARSYERRLSRLRASFITSRDSTTG